MAGGLIMQIYQADQIITENKVLKNAYLFVEAGKIKKIEEEISEDEKAKLKNNITYFSGSKIIPGLIDIHTHGGLGYMAGIGGYKGLKKWSQFKIKHGVTNFLPTIGTTAFDGMKKTAADVRPLMKDQTSNIMGLHLEGPFFTEGKKKGAQTPEYLLASFPAKYRDYIEANSDIINYISIDPAQKIAEEITSFCNDLDIKIAAGHSEILYRDFTKIKNQGYRSIIHSFNGMVGLHHRNPGLAYAACMDQELYAEIICDGIHVSYSMLELFFKLKDFSKIILITDSVLAAGLKAGSYKKHNNIILKVTEDGRVYNNNGNLAGSTLTMDQALKNTVTNLEIPLIKAVQMAALNPAKLLGVSDQKGSLKVGKDADFVILNNDLDVKATYIKGEKVF